MRTKKRLCQLLRYLVKESLAGRSDQLKGYTIGLEVFSRDKDFNPELDPIVRIQAGRLRRSLENYYLNEGKNDPIRIFIPKGRYVPVFLPQDSSQLHSLEQQKNIEKINLTSSARPSIAVLPFTNLTGDPERDYLVQGFAEELSLELTRFEDFRTIKYRTKSSDKNNFYNAKEVVKEMNTNYIVEGSIRLINDQLKISIKLIDAFTGEHLWAEQYIRTLTPDNLIILQENISQQIAAIIAGEYGIVSQKLLNESRNKAPKNLNTYEAMLKFYYYHTVLSSESFLNALTSLQLAIEREPDCVPALTMLADLYFNCYTLDLPGIENPLEKGIELIEKAIVFDPRNQLAQIVFALSHFLRSNKQAFFNAIDNALELNPHSNFRIGGIGFLLCLYGEWERGKTLLQSVMKLNPTFPNWYYGPLSCYYYRSRDYKSAYQEALKYDMKNNFWGPMLCVACLGQLEQKADAQQHISTLKILKPDFESKAHYLISRYVKEEELVEQIIEGLKKGGMKVPPNQVK